ncbi:MAG: DUF1566 domain-containing protein [Paraglaciecola sp.]|uniref:Lcl C-terminal domain-containing protein n=1 Tax=Paraglaciecola sp. TaxID=1920173 RepID=UPI003264A5F4
MLQRITKLTGSFVVFSRALWMALLVTYLASCGGGTTNTNEPEEPNAAPAPVYEISLLVNGNGSLSASPPLQVTSGESIDFSIEADLGWELSDISGCNGTLNGAIYTTGSIISGCLITANFIPQSFTININTSENGIVDATSPQLINFGESVFFSVIADPGFSIDSVVGCDGALSGTTYTASSVQSNCSITALFEANEYDVQVMVSAGGQVSPDTIQTYTHGQVAEFMLIPNTGYIISSVSGCDGLLTGATYRTSALISDCTVTANFTPLVEHLVSFDIGENGTMELSNELISDPQLIVSGATISLIVTPNDGYSIDSITGCTGTLDGLIYEAAAITEDCMITATFKVATDFTVVPISSTGGSIFPSETQIVIENKTIDFEIYNDEDEDYVLRSVSGCGGVLTGTTYKTAPINEHCSVVVEFVQQSLLHDTGITTCSSYDETRTGSLSIYLDNLDCAMQPIPSTQSENGADVNGNIVPAGQDAHYGRDAVDSASLLPKIGAGAAGFDFTRLNNDGTEYSGSGDYETEPWTCVRDNHTGLIWEVKEPINGIYNESERDGDDLYIWHSVDASRNGVYDVDENYVDRFFPWCHASIGSTRTKECYTSNYVERANGDNLCGINSWRLPSVNELHGLVHYGANPSNSLPELLIDTDYFPNINAERAYFTRMAANDYPSTTQESVWTVSFNRAYSSVGTLGIDQRGAAMLVSGEDPLGEPDNTETFEMKIKKAESYSIFRNDFLPIARHEKCINCHEFRLRNEVGSFTDVRLRHIDEGRIPLSFRDSDCVACHTEATGYVDDWRPPLPGIDDTNFLTSRATPDVVCQAMNRLIDPAHHLLEDHLILWAVEQIPDLTIEDWTELVESMVIEGTEDVFTCSQP